MINAKVLAIAIAAAALCSQPVQLSSGKSPLPQPTKACFHNCRIDDTGIAFLKHFEGFSPFPYKDVAGIETVGFGHVIQKDEHIPAPLLGDAAQTMLENDANGKSEAINRLVQVPLSPWQADALISFAFNLGEVRLAHSTLLRCVNRRQHARVPAEFLKWDHAGGREVGGLKARRRAEAALYIEGAR